MRRNAPAYVAVTRAQHVLDTSETRDELLRLFHHGAVGRNRNKRPRPYTIVKDDRVTSFASGHRQVSAASPSSGFLGLKLRHVLLGMQPECLGVSPNPENRRCYR